MRSYNCPRGGASYTECSVTTTRRSVPVLTAALGLVTLGWSDDIAAERTTPRRDVQALHLARREPARPRLDGSDFPDGVLALTWDDGPDANTVELARYLESQRVSGTFFVVGDWSDPISEEPGIGPFIYETGYRHLPVLGELIAHGHRVGAHTENHADLYAASEATVADQLGKGLQTIDPFLTNELRMFRAPGGMWNATAEAALADPFFADLAGPIHWDIDGKDWEGSLYCRSDRSSDCEPGPIPGRTRVRPAVIARRYLSQAERRGHGVVLLHDRVGDVGSRYALDVARLLVPALAARGFVFASPILAFGSLAPRMVHRESADIGHTHFGDIDGDGKQDVCRLADGELVCARAVSLPDHRGVPHEAFEPEHVVLALPDDARSVHLADIDGDHRADICILGEQTLDCALSEDGFAFGPLRHLGADLPRFGAVSAFRLADIDGDRRADACVDTKTGTACATAFDGDRFGSFRLWRGARTADFEIADVNGDGRADLCARSAGGHGIDCALSNGRAFEAPHRWSMAGDFDDGRGLQLADLNHDGRADVCVRGTDGIACAFSDGRRFKRSSRWSDAATDEFRLADINGDGRADLCTVASDGLDCGMAP